VQQEIMNACLMSTNETMRTVHHDRSTKIGPKHDAALKPFQLLLRKNQSHHSVHAGTYVDEHTLGTRDYLCGGQWRERDRRRLFFSSSFRLLLRL